MTVNEEEIARRLREAAAGRDSIAQERRTTFSRPERFIGGPVGVGDDGRFYPPSPGQATSIHDTTEIAGVINGLMMIERQRIWADGAKLGGDFLVASQHAGWLADQLERAADGEISEVALDAAPDHLVVFVRGGEHGGAINIHIHVHNRRESSEPDQKTYTLSAMSPDTARRLAANMRAYKA